MTDDRNETPGEDGFHRGEDGRFSEAPPRRDRCTTTVEWIQQLESYRQAHPEWLAAPELPAAPLPVPPGLTSLLRSGVQAVKEAAGGSEEDVRAVLFYIGEALEEALTQCELAEAAAAAGDAPE